MRHFVNSLFLGLVLAACAATPPDSKPAIRKPLRAGAGEAIINLPIGHSTAGYLQSSVLAYDFPDNDPGSPFADLFPATRGVQSTPKAKAVLVDNGVTLFAFAKIDAIFTADVLTTRVIVLAKQELGLDLKDRLILSATHTHDAGCRFATSMKVKLLQGEEGWRQDAVGHGTDSFNPESLDRVARSIVAALGRARENMKPAALGYARGESKDGSRDRRCQDDELYTSGNIDQAVRLIRIDEVDAAGASVAPIAVLVNYAMHGTIFGSNNGHLSVDAPGLVEAKLEERFDQKVSVLYMQGTAGDVSPSGEGDGSQRMEDVGYRVANTAYDLYQAVTGAAPAARAAKVEPLSTDLPITVKTRRIPISHALLGYESGEFYKDGAILCLIGVNDSCSEAINPVSTNGVPCVGIGLPKEGKYHTDILAAQIGPLTIATIPGEAVSEVGRQLLAKAAEEGMGETLLYAYAQDHNGYLLMPDDWLRGGYEPTISYWGWKFVPYLLEQQGDLFHELKTGEALKKHATPAVKSPDLAFEAVKPAASRNAPKMEAPAASYARLSAVRAHWTGGDPALGMPAVTIERKEGSSYVPLLRNGWRPVDNAGYEIVTDYQADPSYSTDKTATLRDHRWTATWEIPAWVPVGTYRVSVAGASVATFGGEAKAYALHTAPFAVTANEHLVLNQACDSDGNGSLDLTGDYFEITTDATGIHVKMAAFLPQGAPIMEQRFSGGEDQIGNYRLWSERGTAAFPIATPLRGTLEVLRGASSVGTISLAIHDAGGPAKLNPRCPGSAELPFSEGTLAWAGAAGDGSYTVRFQTGDVTDEFGNAVSATTSASFAH